MGTVWSFLGIGGEEHAPAAADFVVLRCVFVIIKVLVLIITWTAQ